MADTQSLHQVDLQTKALASVDTNNKSSNLSNYIQGKKYSKGSVRRKNASNPNNSRGIGHDSVLQMQLVFDNIENIQEQLLNQDHNSNNDLPLEPTDYSAYHQQKGSPRQKSKFPMAKGFRALGNNSQMVHHQKNRVVNDKLNSTQKQFKTLDTTAQGPNSKGQLQIGKNLFDDKFPGQPQKTRNFQLPSLNANAAVTPSTMMQNIYNSHARSKSIQNQTMNKTSPDFQRSPQNAQHSVQLGGKRARIQLKMKNAITGKDNDDLESSAKQMTKIDFLKSTDRDFKQAMMKTRLHSDGRKFNTIAHPTQRHTRNVSQAEKYDKLNPQNCLSKVDQIQQFLGNASKVDFDIPQHIKKANKVNMEDWKLPRQNDKCKNILKVVSQFKEELYEQCPVQTYNDTSTIRHGLNQTQHMKSSQMQWDSQTFANIDSSRIILPQPNLSKVNHPIQIKDSNALGLTAREQLEQSMRDTQQSQMMQLKERLESYMSPKHLRRRKQFSQSSMTSQGFPMPPESPTESKFNKTLPADISKMSFLPQISMGDTMPSNPNYFMSMNDSNSRANHTIQSPILAQKLIQTLVNQDGRVTFDKTGRSFSKRVSSNTQSKTGKHGFEKFKELMFRNNAPNPIAQKKQYKKLREKYEKQEVVLKSQYRHQQSISCMAQIGVPSPIYPYPFQNDTDTIEGSIEMIAKRAAKVMADQVEVEYKQLIAQMSQGSQFTQMSRNKSGTPSRTNTQSQMQMKQLPNNVAKVPKITEMTEEVTNLDATNIQVHNTKERSNSSSRQPADGPSSIPIKLSENDPKQRQDQSREDQSMQKQLSHTLPLIAGSSGRNTQMISRDPTNQDFLQKIQKQADKYVTGNRIIRPAQEINRKSSQKLRNQDLSQPVFEAENDSAGRKSSLTVKEFSLARNAKAGNGSKMGKYPSKDVPPASSPQRDDFNGPAGSSINPKLFALNNQRPSVMKNPHYLTNYNNATNPNIRTSKHSPKVKKDKQEGFDLEVKGQQKPMGSMQSWFVDQTRQYRRNKRNAKTKLQNEQGVALFNQAYQKFIENQMGGDGQVTKITQDMYNILGQLNAQSDVSLLDEYNQQAQEQNQVTQIQLGVLNANGTRMLSPSLTNGERSPMSPVSPQTAQGLPDYGPLAPNIQIGSPQPKGLNPKQSQGQIGMDKTGRNSNAHMRENNIMGGINGMGSNQSLLLTNLSKNEASSPDKISQRKSQLHLLMDNLNQPINMDEVNHIQDLINNQISENATRTIDDRVYVQPPFSPKVPPNVADSKKKERERRRQLINQQLTDRSVVSKINLVFDGKRQYATNEDLAKSRNLQADARRSPGSSAERALELEVAPQEQIKRKEKILTLPRPQQLPPHMNRESPSPFNLKGQLDHSVSIHSVNNKLVKKRASSDSPSIKAESAYGTARYGSKQDVSKATGRIPLITSTQNLTLKPGQIKEIELSSEGDESPGKEQQPAAILLQNTNSNAVDTQSSHIIQIIDTNKNLQSLRHLKSIQQLQQLASMRSLNADTNPGQYDVQTTDRNSLAQLEFLKASQQKLNVVNLDFNPGKPSARKGEKSHNVSPARMKNKVSKIQLRNSGPLDNQAGIIEATNSGALYAQNSNLTTDQFNKTDGSQLNKDVEQYIQGVNMSSRSRFEQSPQKDNDYVAIDHEGRESIDFNSGSQMNRHFIGGSKFPRNQSFVGLRKHSLEKQAKQQQDALQKQQYLLQMQQNDQPGMKIQPQKQDEIQVFFSGGANPDLTATMNTQYLSRTLQEESPNKHPPTLEIQSPEKLAPYDTRQGFVDYPGQEGIYVDSKTVSGGQFESKKSPLVLMSPQAARTNGVQPFSSREGQVEQEVQLTMNTLTSPKVGAFYDGKINNGPPHLYTAQRSLNPPMLNDLEANDHSLPGEQGIDKATPKTHINKTQLSLEEQDLTPTLGKSNLHIASPQKLQIIGEEAKNQSAEKPDENHESIKQNETANPVQGEPSEPVFKNQMIRNIRK